MKIDYPDDPMGRWRANQEEKGRVKMSEETVGLRDSLAAFAQDMEQRLRANDHKSGWHDMTARELMRRLWQEATELADVINGKQGNIIKEAADVANFAMMIADNAREEATTDAQ